MVEKSLLEKLQRIFDLKKISFDRPSDSKEQEAGFIEVRSTFTTYKEGLEFGRVDAKLLVFASTEVMPLGYFAKQIAAARPEDIRDLFFYDFDETAATFGNLVNRSVSFIYLYQEQYDPNHGEITSVNLSIAETL
jgi:hypothetical protein